MYGCMNETSLQICLFSKHYNVQVTGIDIEEELVRISQERCVAMGMSDKVFRHAHPRTHTHVDTN